MRLTHLLAALGLVAVIFASSAFGITAVNITNRPNEHITNTTSSNWAGYVVASTFSQTCTGNGKHKTCTGASPVVTAAYGSWIVQTVSASSSNTYSSQWVGIGGYFDSTLIQTGTESDYVSGAASYNAWYELLPASETPISMTVSPGNVINASVVCVSSCTSSTQSWNITLDDVTTGAHFSIVTSYSSSLLSAEWIEERPALCFAAVCSLSTLANFGTANYGTQYTSVLPTNYAVVSSVSATPQPIGSLPYQSITMESCSGHGPNSCTTLASPSTLSDSGTSFYVTYG
ncbi:MAG: hypothetical protein JRN67_13195 [Nitrososphaerota archaeon]|nr:hypothetical protein [Nitrososphaerota archaeon]